MKITLSTSEVIEGIYANSALRAEAAQWPNGAIAAILHTDDEPALRRMAGDAFAAAIALTSTAAVPWRIVTADDLTLAACCPDLDDAAPACIDAQATATSLLRSATIAALLAIIWRGLDRHLYTAAHDEAVALIRPLATAVAPAPARILPSF